MQTLLLTTDGSMLHAGKIVENNVLRRFSAPVQLEEGYSLRSFFALAEKYPEIAQTSEFFPSFLERYNASPKSGCATPEVDFLELTRVVEMIGFPGKPRMELYTSLHGVSGGEQKEIRFIQIEDLLDVELRLGGLRHIVLGDEADIFEFQTVFTLFDFVEGVTWELSFHGTPMECKLGR